VAFAVLYLYDRSIMKIRFLTISVSTVLALALLQRSIGSSLHNISYANLLEGSARAAAGASTSDALKAALQKRLLVPDPTMLIIGPPSSGPLSGMTQRDVTISNGQGQKAELKYFTTGNSTDKGLITREYISFDSANPWQRADLTKLHLADHAVMGPESAPITIIEFADFECPYCARAYNEIETLVNTTYKDRVRLLWKNFPLPAHTWAQQGAIAAECARQQNPKALWTFAESFYRDQGDITAQNLRQHIDQYASAAGLDAKALNACVLSDAAEKRVDQDRTEGEAIHINSTPTFLINGVMVVGLPTSNIFDFVITSQLKEKSTAR
jgi:protein-disulfide isomerase